MSPDQILQPQSTGARAPADQTVKPATLTSRNSYSLFDGGEDHRKIAERIGLLPPAPINQDRR